MKDEQLLKKLYELDELEGSEAKDYVAKWIDDTKIVIAEDSAKSVGFGDGFKAMKKIISGNKKSNPELAFALKSSKKNSFVITDGAQAVRIKNDYGLPTTGLKVEHADRLIEIFEQYKARCTKPINRPNRYDLDFIIKDWKAQPKKERGAFPLYDFGKGLPCVNAEKFMNIASIFPTTICYVDSSKGAMSPIYFRYESFEGLLMPVRK